MAPSQKCGIGIDLGTANTCTTIFRNDKAEIVLHDGQPLMPSYVAFTETVHLVGGAAKRQAGSNPMNTISEAMRFIGRKFSDSYVQYMAKTLPFRVSERRGEPVFVIEYVNQELTLSPMEIIAMILARVKKDAQAHLGSDYLIAGAVITVPASFNMFQRQTIWDAAIVAKLNPLRLINAAVTTCTEYAVRTFSHQIRNVLCVDFGAGSVDVAASILEDGIIEIKAVAGNSLVGGADMDACLVRRVKKKFERRWNYDPTEAMRPLRRLRTACEEAKCELSFQMKTHIEVDALSEGHDFAYSISREDLDECCRSLLQNSLAEVERVMKDAHFAKDSIDKVLVTGGSSRVPYFITALSQMLGDEQKIFQYPNPFEPASAGAAIQAAILCGDTSSTQLREIILLDVAPFSISIETTGGMATTIFPRNAIIPSLRVMNFTSDDGKFKVSIFEGERARVKDNLALGRFELDLDPSTPGNPSVDVRVDYNANSRILVTATETISGRHRELFVSDLKGLTKEDSQILTAMLEKFDLIEQAEQRRLDVKQLLEDYVFSLVNRADTNSHADHNPGNKFRLSHANYILHWLDKHPNVGASAYEEVLKGLRLRVETPSGEFVDEDCMDLAPTPLDQSGRPALTITPDDTLPMKFTKDNGMPKQEASKIIGESVRANEETVKFVQTGDLPATANAEGATPSAQVAHHFQSTASPDLLQTPLVTPSAANIESRPKMVPEHSTELRETVVDEDDMWGVFEGSKNKKNQKKKKEIEHMRIGPDIPPLALERLVSLEHSERKSDEVQLNSSPSTNIASELQDQLDERVRNIHSSRGASLEELEAPAKISISEDIAEQTGQGGVSQKFTDIAGQSESYVASAPGSNPELPFLLKAPADPPTPRSMTPAASFGSTESGMQELFPTSKVENKRYSDSEFIRISTYLRNSGRSSWSSVPRLYTVLRLIQNLHEIDNFIEQGITDIWFPFSHQSLPSTLSPTARSQFLERQDAVFSKSLVFETDPVHKHAHFSQNDPLPFQIIGKLGSGAHGHVDKVMSTVSHREYARKQFRRRKGTSKDAIKSFLVELQVLKRVQHQHCIELVHSYTDPKFFALLMVPVAECDLYEYYNLARNSPDRISLLRSFLGCLANALQYIHSIKIRHRDIKPQNILVNGDRVFLTDFGIALDWEHLSRSTTTADSAKTLIYAAPEVVRFEKRNTAADVWSLGCVFMEIVTVLKGESLDAMRAFFTSKTSNYRFYANIANLPQWAKTLRGTGLPKDDVIFKWVRAMLEEDGDERPTASELYDDIVKESGAQHVPFCGSCCLEMVESSSAEEDEDEDLWERAAQLTVVPGRS